MPLLHPSGGLLYHLRAWRWQNMRWLPFHSEVARWLDAWQPEAAELVLVGPDEARREIDCRPSDAIALLVRHPGVILLVNDVVLAEAGEA